MIRRPPEPPRGLDGLPVADPLEDRIARAVTIVASIWFALAAAWELFGPVLAGHYSSSASVGIMAENMIHWRIPGPVWEYSRLRPPPSSYYCHHPWGIFWTTAALMEIFGRHDFICRLAPVILSAATPPLLSAIGRAIWRPAAGAAAAAAFVVLPITLSFAAFNALEVPVIAWSLLGLWGFIRLTQTGRRRHLAVALAGMFLALHADWAAYMLSGGMLAFGLARLTILRRVFRPIRSERRYAVWWALTTVISAATLLLYLALFRASGKLDDLFGSYTLRSSGNAVPLSRVLYERRYWIELSFTPVAIAIGKIAAVVSLIRLVVLRREHEVIPLLVLVMSVLQYIVFKQGADVHIFWPQYFGAYFALAMGALVATIAPIVSWASARVARLRRRDPSPDRDARGAIAALGLALVPIAVIARDGIPALRYARETGGRFNEKGVLIHSDGAKTAALRFFDPAIPRGQAIDMHESMKLNSALIWAMGGRVVNAQRPVPTRDHPADAAYFADTRFFLDHLQGDLARDFHVTAVGPFWKVAEREPAAPIDAFAIVEREPSWWEWYFVCGTEPHRDIVPDPYRTWELRAHFDQPREIPRDPPASFDQRRIAYNIAVSEGDAARAAAILADLEREISQIHAAFDDGTEILGASYHEGARSLLTILVRAGGPTTADVQLTVKSKVTAPPRLSTTMLDPIEREVGLPLSIAPQRWKKGFLYSDLVPIRRRPGSEVFRASFWVRGAGTAPKLVGPGSAVTVLTLP